jgi:hypothetical protein
VLAGDFAARTINDNFYSQKVFWGFFNCCVSFSLGCCHLCKVLIDIVIDKKDTIRFILTFYEKVIIKFPTKVMQKTDEKYGYR